MKILIISNLSATDMGGSAQYGPRLLEEFQRLGHESRLTTYGPAEKQLPTFIRHSYFLKRIFGDVRWADAVLALDTFSVGLPSLAAAKMFGKKLVVRVGGDFLWESYVNGGGKPLTLLQFYARRPRLGLKGLLIAWGTKLLVHRSDMLAFNTEWQKEIWAHAYNISKKNMAIVRNHIPPKQVEKRYAKKNFVWAGRDSKVKNREMIERIASRHPEYGIEIYKNLPHETLLEKIAESYAVILPSLSDVCPNFILEAVSYNKPFIMTKETGLTEICSDGGLFVDTLDEEKVEEAIIRMMNEAEYTRCLSCVRSSTLERSWKTVAGEYIAICQSL